MVLAVSLDQTRRVHMSGCPRSLQAMPLFAELTAQELEGLCEILEERTFEKNQVIDREDEPWEGLYVIRSGRAKLSKGSMGRDLTVTILEPGEPLNITPLFEGGSNVFTTQALGAVSTYYLSEPDARAFVSDHPPVQKALLHALNRRIRLLVTLASELSFTRVSARLASWLLKESEDRGIRTGRGIEIKRDLRLRELASLLGTVRRVLSRSLAELQQDGAIEVASDHIIIVDQERLRARVQGC